MSQASRATLLLGSRSDRVERVLYVSRKLKARYSIYYETRVAREPERRDDIRIGEHAGNDIIQSNRACGINLPDIRYHAVSAVSALCIGSHPNCRCYRQTPPAPIRPPKHPPVWTGGSISWIYIILVFEELQPAWSPRSHLGRD